MPALLAKLFGRTPARPAARRPALALEALDGRIVPANLSPRPPAGVGRPAAVLVQPPWLAPQTFTARVDQVVSVSDPGRRADVAGLTLTTDGGRIGLTVPRAGTYSAVLSPGFGRSGLLTFRVTTTRTTEVPVVPPGAIVTIPPAGGNGVEITFPPIFGRPSCGPTRLPTQTFTTTETVSGTLTVGPTGRPVGLTFSVDVTTSTARPTGTIAGSGPPATTTHLGATVTLK